MANFDIKIPLPSFDKKHTFITEKGNLDTRQALQKLKSNKQVSSAVNECSKNSNVPEEFIYSMILALSNGNNNPPYSTADTNLPPRNIPDPLVRMGYFSLSNVTARVCLADEIFNKRINAAEKEYLNKYGNANVKSFIADVKPAGFQGAERWWSYSKTGGAAGKMSDATALTIPFNLESPELNICIGTMILGQCWDFYSKYYTRPLVPVVISMLLPYDNAWIGNYVPFNTTILRGNLSAIKDWDNFNVITKIPSPESGPILNKTAKGIVVTFDPKKLGSMYNVINPYGGWVGTYASAVVGKDGALENLVNKNV